MGYVSDFSPDGKLLGLLDPLGGLKIWNVENKFLVRPNRHLQCQYTCLTWLSGTSIFVENGAANNINRENVINWNDFVALGKTNGSVDLYSYATSSITYGLAYYSHMDAVTAICWDSSKLFTIGKDHTILVWSWEDSHFEPWKIIAPSIPTAITPLSSNRLVVACKDLHLWLLLPTKDVNPDWKPIVNQENSADISSIKLLKEADQNGTYVLTASKLKQEICLWKIDKPEKLITFHAGNFICCSMQSNKLMIAASNMSAFTTDLFIIGDIRNITRNDQKCIPNVTVKSTSDHQFVPIVVASLKSSRKVQIGYGSCASLRFEEITTKANGRVFHDPMPHPNRDSTLARICDTRNDLVQLTVSALICFDASSIRALLLHAHDKNLISSTVAHLPQTSVHKLVEWLTLLIERKICNVGIAAPWLNALLRVQPNRLMASETNNIGNNLKPLLGAIQTRRDRTLKPLLQLKGQLDLLLGQRIHMADNSAISNYTNVIVYDDVEEVVVPRYITITTDEETDISITG
ncbi:uncharacterized protein LOC119084029 isoform X2 [Bradysia coprophila]|uniref:uncharacterized protein LOC119084029 isoform X2 n=1 Tax=Bradysia coprophila TaxID=38358 RepID=UPI00187DB4D1|nr:uncharacterized protein LOC119084029 isoform X2 [Bradysia coprophila]